MWRLAELISKSRNLQLNKQIRHRAVDIRSMRYNIDNSFRAKAEHRESSELKGWYSYRAMMNANNGYFHLEHHP